LGIEPADEKVDLMVEMEMRAKTLYSEIEFMINPIPESFYNASGRYLGMTKQQFLGRAAGLANYTGRDYAVWESNVKELEKMHRYALDLLAKWRRAVQSGTTGSGSSDSTTPIAEDQPKPPQETNYMSYGLIAIIAILVIVLIIVLLRR